MVVASLRLLPSPLISFVPRRSPYSWRSRPSSLVAFSSIHSSSHSTFTIFFFSQATLTLTYFFYWNPILCSKLNIFYFFFLKSLLIYASLSYYLQFVLTCKFMLLRQILRKRVEWSLVVIKDKQKLFFWGLEPVKGFLVLVA